MKTKIKLILEKGSQQVVYIEPRDCDKRKPLYDLQHRLRIIKTIFGYFAVQIYHPDMDFTNAISAGWKKKEIY
jgi:hypothetical protein